MSQIIGEFPEREKGDPGLGAANVTPANSAELREISGA
jgi:hypothetical protein